MSLLNFKKGSLQDLENVKFSEGQFLVTTDSNAIYFDTIQNNEQKRIRIGDYKIVDSESQLPSSDFESLLYLVKDKNILYRYSIETNKWVTVSSEGLKYTLELDSNKNVVLSSFNSSGEEEIAGQISLSMQTIKDETWTRDISTINSKLNEGVTAKDLKHTITIGNIVFDGTSNVVIPIYDGNITPPNSELNLSSTTQYSFKNVDNTDIVNNSQLDINEEDSEKTVYQMSINNNSQMTLI